MAAMPVDTPTRHGGDAPPRPAPPQASVEARIERSVGRLYRWLERNPVTRTPWAVIQTFSRADGALLSGSMAYYTFLSLFPLLLLSGFLAGTVSRFSVDARQALAAAVEQLIPVEEGIVIVQQLMNARAALGIAGLLTMAYAATGFIGAMTACLNRMWKVGQGRNPIGQKLVNVVTVAALGVVLVASFSASLWASDRAREALDGRWDEAVRLLQWVASPVSLFLLLLVLYRLLPACRISWRSQVPGALAGVVFIELLKRGFALWAQHSAGVGAVPRSVLSIVLVIVWLGFLSQAILYGAAINVVIAQRRRRRRSESRTQAKQGEGHAARG